MLSVLQQNPLIGMITSFVSSFLTFLSHKGAMEGLQEIVAFLAAVVGLLIGIITLYLKIKELLKKD